MNSRDIGLSTILAGTWRMAQWVFASKFAMNMPLVKVIKALH